MRSGICLHGDNGVHPAFLRNEPLMQIIRGRLRDHRGGGTPGPLGSGFESFLYNDSKEITDCNYSDSAHNSVGILL